MEVWLAATYRVCEDLSKSTKLLYGAKGKTQSYTLTKLHKNLDSAAHVQIRYTSGMFQKRKSLASALVLEYSTRVDTH